MSKTVRFEYENELGKKRSCLFNLNTVANVWIEDNDRYDISIGENVTLCISFINGVETIKLTGISENDANKKIDFIYKNI